MASACMPSQLGRCHQSAMSLTHHATRLASGSAQRPLPSVSQWNRGGHIGHSARQIQASVAAERPQTRDAAAADAHLLHYRDSQNASNPTTPSIESTDSWHVSDGWRILPHHLPKDKLWSTIVAEAQHDAVRVASDTTFPHHHITLQALEPALASFLHTSIIMHASPERSLSFFLGNKLSSPTLLGVQLTRLFLDAFTDDPTMVDAALADIQAVRDRDPACTSFAQCLLFFKGFQAIQCYRVAHWMWQRGRKTLAMALSSRVAEVFHVDIHPAARIGKGILLDHATGVVIGETAVLGDNCVLLHNVTLGGSGIGTGIRHPNVGNGVLIGAGVSILGPVSVGRGSKIGAGSVVVTSLPPHCVAVGVPAKVVKMHSRSEPVMDMDMVGDFVLDYII